MSDSLPSPTPSSNSAQASADSGTPLLLSAAQSVPDSGKPPTASSSAPLTDDGSLFTRSESLELFSFCNHVAQDLPVEIAANLRNFIDDYIYKRKEPLGLEIGVLELIKDYQSAVWNFKTMLRTTYGIGDNELQIFRASLIPDNTVTEYIHLLKCIRDFGTKKPSANEFKQKVRPLMYNRPDLWYKLEDIVDSWVSSTEDEAVLSSSECTSKTQASPPDASSSGDQPADSSGQKEYTEQVAADIVSSPNSASKKQKAAAAEAPSSDSPIKKQKTDDD